MACAWPGARLERLVRAGPPGAYRLEIRRWVYGWIYTNISGLRLPVKGHCMDKLFVNDLGNFVNDRSSASLW
jgi:hypothetical protein